MEYVRAFIAIELPEEIKRALEALQERLKLKNETGVTCVKPAFSHLTLKFLGATPVEKIEKIEAAMNAVTRDVPAFELELKGAGCFPNARSPRVVWVGLAAGEELPLLQMALEDSMEDLGFPKEDRPFTAHLTLARVRDGCPPEVRRKLGEAVAALDYQPGVKFTADRVSLVRSVLNPIGPEYTTIYRAALKA